MSDNSIVPAAVLAEWTQGWIRSGRSRIGALIDSNCYPSIAELQLPHGRFKLVEARKWLDRCNQEDEAHKRRMTRYDFWSLAIAFITLVVTVILH